MLEASRLAGLSALEAYYASIDVRPRSSACGSSYLHEASDAKRDSRAS
jgi:hypothetical protein